MGARAIHRALEADGHRLSWRTVQRFLEREDSAADVPPGIALGSSVVPAIGQTGNDERFSGERLTDDMKARYLEACAVAESLRAKAHIGSRETRRWAEMVRLASELGVKLCAMAPKPIPDPDKDPAYLEGHRQLLKNAREFLRKAELRKDVRTVPT